MPTTLEAALVSLGSRIIVGVSKAVPHTTWVGVPTLMIMQVAVAAALVGGPATARRRAAPARL